MDTIFLIYIQGGIKKQKRRLQRCLWTSRNEPTPHSAPTTSVKTSKTCSGYSTERVTGHTRIPQRAQTHWCPFSSGYISCQSAARVWYDGLMCKPAANQPSSLAPRASTAELSSLSRGRGGGELPTTIHSALLQGEERSRKTRARVSLSWRYYAGLIPGQVTQLSWLVTQDLPF